jgi:sugar O-acyltransferase (sialic acid O-acetyltransferase NeuD family)
MKKLIIIGGRTGALEVKGIVEDINRAALTYEIAGVLDDDPLIQGGTVGGMPVLGFLDKVGSFAGAKYVFAIGSISTQHKRTEILSRLQVDYCDFETIIHPTAVINASSVIGHGSIVHPRATICNDAHIGNFAIVAVASTVGPYAKIRDFAMVTSHVLVLSGAEIGEAAFVGSMSCIVEKVKVGARARIGVGSVVGRDVAEGVFAMGNPLRLLGHNQ